MLCKQFLLILIASLHLCQTQNILNFLDFAAPLFGLLKAGTPEVCYPDLGCFRNDGVFGRSEQRPISCVPQSPQIIGTQFLFFSRPNIQEYYEIDAIDSHLFDQIDFHPNKKTIIVTHGYKEGLIIQGFSHGTFEEIKDGILVNEDANVILVRWNRGASGFYFQSVANTRVVAAQIAHLINYLITERNARPESFHLIGFSLGAQISGNVGRLIPNLGKISALDAAKPYFDGMPRVARVDEGDALFVEGWHTDNGNTTWWGGIYIILEVVGIGTERQIGSVDIYFNGGRRQPGCARQVTDTAINVGLIDGFFETISCDHKRALHYYRDYLFRANRDCIPVAYRCQSWHHFQSGLCSTCGHDGNDCLELGLNSHLNKYETNGENRFYIMTADRTPFCVHQYLVRISLQTTRAVIDGSFELRVESRNESFPLASHQSPDLQLKTASEVSFVISSELSVTTIEKIGLTFAEREESERNENLILINSLLLTPMNMIDDNEKLRNSLRFCPTTGRWIGNNANNERQSISLAVASNCI